MSNSSTPPSRRPGTLAINQGRSSASTGHWESALAAYDQALAADENWVLDPDFLNDRAVALFHNQRAQESLNLLDRAINLQPDYGYRYAARGWMKQATKDFAGAITDYEKAIELDPDDAITLNNLGLLEEQLGRMKSAQERFSMADALDQVLTEKQIDKASPAPKTERTPQEGSAINTPAKQPKRTVFREINQALFTVQGRKEFIDFIRNGFKLNG